MKTRNLISLTAIVYIIVPLSAYSADLAGTVTNGLEQPVPGVQIQLQDASGKTLAQQLTDPAGHYKFTGLASGEYECVLDPLGSAVKGGTLQANVAPEGTTLDWKLAANALPITASYVGLGAPAGNSASQIGSAERNLSNNGGNAADPLFVHSGPIGNPVGGPPNHGLGSGSSSQ